jgi:hypothetical protein
LGLLTWIGLGSYQISFDPQGAAIRIAFTYFGKAHLVTIPFDRPEMQTGKVRFSSIGSELASIALAGATPDEAYRQKTVERWRKMNLIVEEAFAAETNSHGMPPGFGSFIM